MEYSKTLVYQNGKRVKNGEDGDHVTVRNLLNTGIIPKVDNFGPLLSAESKRSGYATKTDGLEKMVVGDFELFIQPHDEIMNFNISTLDFGTAKNVNVVYYQRTTD